MDNIEVEALEERPSFGARPAGVLSVVIDYCIEYDSYSTVLNQVLVLIRADVLAD